MNNAKIPIGVSVQFVKYVHDALNANGEVFVVLQYIGKGGSKDYAICSSLPEVDRIICEAEPRTYISAFRCPQLCIRGIVNDMLQAEVLGAYVDGEEYLGISAETLGGTCKSKYWCEGCEREQLRRDLEECYGKQWCFGSFPDYNCVDKDVVLTVLNSGPAGPV